MASLKDLYELVHALKKNEKKHINLMIQALGSKARDRYLDSFKAINKLKEYDENKLKQSLTKGFSGMNLSEANNNLYSFIGDSILSYKNNGVSNYTRQLALIEFYIGRKLFAKSHKLLQKLIPELREKGTYGTLQRAEELQENLTILYPKINADTAFRIQFLKDRKVTLGNTQLYLELLELKFEFFQLARTIGTPRNQSEFNSYKKLWDNKIMHIPIEQIPNRTSFAYYQLKGVLSSMLHIEISGGGIEQFVNDFRNRFEGNKASYTGEFNLQDLLLGVISSSKQIEMEQIEKVENRINKLLLYLNKPILAVRAKAKIHIIKLLHFMQKKKYQDGVSYFEEVLNSKDEWNEAPSSYVVTLIGANMQFMLDQPNSCLESLASIEGETKKMTPTYLSYFHFLNLITHYKLGHYQYLESATRSLYRHLLKTDKIYAPEKAMLSFLKHGNDINKMEQNFGKLHSTFMTLEHHKFHNIFFAHGNYLELLEKVQK